MALACGLDFCPCRKAGECPNAGNCEPCIARHKQGLVPNRPLPWCLREENQEKIKLMKEQGHP